MLTATVHDLSQPSLAANCIRLATTSTTVIIVTIIVIIVIVVMGIGSIVPSI